MPQQYLGRGCVGERTNLRARVRVRARARVRAIRVRVRVMVSPGVRSPRALPKIFLVPSST